MLGEQEIESRFGLHAAAIEGPNAASSEMHKDLRQAFKLFAKVIDEVLPDHPHAMRYRELAMDDLERSSMWAHKAIAKMNPVVSE